MGASVDQVLGPLVDPSQKVAEALDGEPVYVISIAAQLSGLHPQTLRQYDRLGLVSPD
ncbi:MerR family DNA-binding transcriptional regulator, partial [Streptomyces sp. NPDC005121]